LFTQPSYYDTSGPTGITITFEGLAPGSPHTVLLGAQGDQVTTQLGDEISDGMSENLQEANDYLQNIPAHVLPPTESGTGDNGGGDGGLG
jgi:hypothetical protein